MADACRPHGYDDRIPQFDGEVIAAVDINNDQWQFLQILATYRPSRAYTGCGPVLNKRATVHC